MFCHGHVHGRLPYRIRIADELVTTTKWSQSDAAAHIAEDIFWCVDKEPNVPLYPLLIFSNEACGNANRYRTTSVPVPVRQCTDLDLLRPIPLPTITLVYQRDCYAQLEPVAVKYDAPCRLMSGGTFHRIQKRGFTLGDILTFVYIFYNMYLDEKELSAFGNTADMNCSYDYEKYVKDTLDELRNQSVCRRREIMGDCLIFEGLRREKPGVYVVQMDD